MDRMTITQLLAHVRANLGSATDLASDTRVIDWINWAVEDTASVRNWADMKRWVRNEMTTQEGVHAYPLPIRTKDILTVKFYEGTSSTSPFYVEPDLFDKRFPDPQSRGNGTPAFYTWDEDGLKFSQAFSDTGIAVHLHLALWPELFTSGEEDMLCPLSRLEPAIVALATAYGFDTRSEPEKCMYWTRNWWKSVRRRAHAERTRSDWTLRYASIRVRDRARDAFDVPPLDTQEES